MGDINLMLELPMGYLRWQILFPNCFCATYSLELKLKYAPAAKRHLPYTEYKRTYDVFIFICSSRYMCLKNSNKYVRNLVCLAQGRLYFLRLLYHRENWKLASQVKTFMCRRIFLITANYFKLCYVGIILRACLIQTCKLYCNSMHYLH